MEWLTPKTDWAPSTDAQGKYVGDFLNIEDYNRIKNNIEFLAHLARSFWPVKVKALPNKAHEEYPYADEINQISDNLDELNRYVNCNIGTKTEYSENGAYINFEDLNRIESATVDIYERLQVLYSKPKHLPYRLGAEYWPLKNPKVRKIGRTHLPFKLGARLGGAYYPFKMPDTPDIPETKQKRLPFRLGSEYWPFEN